MKESVNQPEIDNARIGYQVAVNLWISEGELLWSKYLNSGQQHYPCNNQLNHEHIELSKGVLGMPIVGIILCGL